MKNFHYFFCFFLVLFFLSKFSVLSQAGARDVPDEIIKNIVGFLDQKSWIMLLRVNRKFYELTLEGVSIIQVHGDSAAEIKSKLSSFLIKNESDSQLRPALEKLDLTNSSITDEGLKDLVEFIQKNFSNINQLNLAQNKISGQGAAHLAVLVRLKSLNLYWNGIGPEGARHLAGLTQLETLNLMRSKIDAAAAAHLRGLIHLKILNLYGNNIGAAGAVYLEGLTQLKVLDLGYNEIGSAGAVYLARLTQLERLELNDNGIGSAGAVYLEGLTQLKFLNLFGNGISDESIRSLREVLGGSVTIIYR